jgi:molybdopterin-guanine dinucleotide biosynthesis protein A
LAASEPVTGLILAGGEGRRVGGADKGLLDYRGKPLVAHVIERFAPQVDALLISANRNLDAYLDYGYPVVTDASAERLGPLAGIAAGLRACDTPWLVVCPCDCPQLPPDLVARLMAGIGQARLAIGRSSEGTQPTFMLCRRELLPALAAWLAAGERKVMAWCRNQGAVEVDFPDAAAFANFNTPDALTGD